MEYKSLRFREDGTPLSVEHTGAKFAVSFQPEVKNIGISFKTTVNKDDGHISVMHVAFKTDPLREKVIDELLGHAGEATAIIRNSDGAYETKTVPRKALVSKVRQDIEGYTVKMYGVANTFTEPLLK